MRTYHQQRISSLHAPRRLCSCLVVPEPLSSAEDAVLWQVRDTVVEPRDELARWVADNLPRDSDISVDDCLRAIEALLRKRLLVELTAEDIAADLARWESEPLPVSFGVDRRRRPGDVDLTEAGFQLCEAVSREKYPNSRNLPAAGYNDEQPGVIRVFGETEDRCRDYCHRLIELIGERPWQWPRDSIRVGEIEPLGPWWESRFELIPTGFQILIRRA